MACTIFKSFYVTLIWFVTYVDSHHATTFTNIIYRRGVPYGGRMTETDCVDTCRRVDDCWGVNFAEGRGRCELLNQRSATCGPASHVYAPRGLKTTATWVKPCPLQKNAIRSNMRESFKQYASFAKRFSTSVCPENKYQWNVYRNSHMVNGVKLRGWFTLLQCLDSCVGYPGCSAIVYNEDERSCSHFMKFTTTHNPIQRAYCCHYAVLECLRPVKHVPFRPQLFTHKPFSTTSPPEYSPEPTTPAPSTRHHYTNPYAKKTTTPRYTTRPAPTNAPPYPKPKTIGVHGCPGPFLKQEFTGRQGGMPVWDLPENTTESCLKYCLNMGDTCKAADFDHTTNLCYYFTTEDPMMLPTGQKQCCTHYIRLNCDELEKRSCYEHQPFIFFSNPNDHNVIVSAMPPLNPPDLSLVDCDGVCFQTLDYLPDVQLFTVERGCDRTLNADRHWKHCDVSTDPLDFDKDCRCGFDRCNGINTEEFDHLSCHYAFDKNVLDDSGFQRHGKPTNITYDPVNSARSYSAVFDGVSSFIFFPSWRLVHVEKISPGGRPFLSFTIAMWIKRPSIMYGYPGSIDTMTVLSTGTRDNSAVQILSDIEFANPWTPEHKIRASVYIDNTRHEVVATAPLDQFFFLAFRLDGFQAVPRLTLDIDSLEDLTPEDSLELTNGTVTDELSVNTRGLYLGKQAAPVPYLYPDHFFKGQLDDFFCYDKSLSYHALLALRDLSLPLP